MDITYLGHSCFKIKGKTLTVVTDPFDASVGLKLPKVEADIVTVSHDHGDHAYISGVSDVKRVLAKPGEYEVSGTSFFGIPAYHDEKKGEERGKNTIFVIVMDGVTLCHLGDLGQKSLTESQLSAIGNIDILFVPVGGFYTIGSEVAVGVAQAIEPKIIIPMHYKTSGHDAAQFGQLETVDKFVTASGLKSETLPKLSYKPGDILEGEEKLYVLEVK